MDVQRTSTAPQDWDAYVNAHERGTAYHLGPVVAIGSQAFDLQTTYLSARDRHSNRIVGVLPLVEQSSMLFGRYLVSLPFFTYGGILANDADVSAALVAEAIKIGEERNVDHIELRHTQELAELHLARRLDKVSMVLSLPGTEEELAKRLGSKLRSQIRRADREALEIVWGGEELLPDFYNVFSRGMHELGTPVYSRRFFEVVAKAFGKLGAVLVVRIQGQPHAAAILVRHGNTIEVPWASADPIAKRASVNMRMYWEMLRYSIAQGATHFDFGRSSPDSGTYKFKRQWGAEPRQLYWHHWLPNGRALTVLNHSNPKYAAAAAIWRRMPLWAANLLGPFIVRNLP